jgi:hypothetical protein
MNYLEAADVIFLARFGFCDDRMSCEDAYAILERIVVDPIVLKRSEDFPNPKYPEFPAIVAEDAHEQVISRMTPKELRELKDRMAAP